MEAPHETATPRFSRAVRIPQAVLDAQRAVREGRATPAEANRSLGVTARPRAATASAERKREALRGARERLARYEKSQKSQKG